MLRSNIFYFIRHFGRVNFRKFSSESTIDRQTKVVLSTSICPYKNLAFENYIYENDNFTDEERTLFIWRNQSAVVIGRHQNPWKEVDLKRLQRDGINLCRRMSGGGSVYHDLGNVNFTFFTSKNNYDRKQNLDFIIKTLSDNFQLNIIRNEKDDIVFQDEFKVSGTAAKLGLKNCYHHCTLLCDTNLKNLSGLLTNPFGANIKTNATESVKSKTKNIFEKNFCFEKLVEVFTFNYYQTYSNITNDFRILKMNPDNFPDVIKKSQELKSWDWVFGKAPKFTITKSLTLMNGECFDFKVIVNKGRVSGFDAQETIDNKEVSNIVYSLIGTKFEYNEFLSLLLEHSQNDKKNLFICNQILKWFEN